MKLLILSAALLLLAGCDCKFQANANRGNHHGWRNKPTPVHNVPDHGATVALLGLGIVGVIAARKRR